MKMIILHEFLFQPYDVSFLAAQCLSLICAIVFTVKSSKQECKILVQQKDTNFSIYMINVFQLPVLICSLYRCMDH